MKQLLILLAIIPIISFGQTNDLSKIGGGAASLNYADVDSAETIKKVVVYDSLNALGKVSVIQHEDIVTLGVLYTNGDSVTTIGSTGTYITIRNFVQDTSLNTTITDSTITISKSGWYFVGEPQSFTFSVVNTVVHSSLFIDDVESKLEQQRTVTTGGNVGFSGASMPYYFDSGDVLKLKAKADKTGDLTINHGYFWVFKIN